MRTSPIRADKQKPSSFREIAAVLASLSDAKIDQLNDSDRSTVLDQVIPSLVEKVNEYRKRGPIEIEYDPSKSTWFAVHHLMERASAVGRDGPVAQYLVGAKLQQRFPNLEISNERHSAADVQTGRHGDFVVGDTAIHVTVRPMEGVYKKCLRNLKQGIRPLLIVPAELAEGARVNAELNAPGQIAVTSIESFVGQNIEEMSNFSAADVRASFSQLLRIYNLRVDEVELDKSILIETPANL